MKLNLIAATIAAAFLAEGMDDAGCTKLNKLQAIAIDVGGTGFAFEEGACSVEIEGPEAAQQYLTALDGEDYVEGYDVTHDGEETDEEDILALPVDTVFNITAYLNEDHISYAAEETDAEDMDEPIEEGVVRGTPVDAYGVHLDEVAKKIAVTSKGVKRIKMQCPKGFKFNAEAKACVKIAGDELAVRRKASVKALVSRKAGGNALKARAAVKTKKAMNFRKAMGLK